jgi:hypothetical protein
MFSDERGQESDCRGWDARGIPRLENRETWATRQESLSRKKKGYCQESCRSPVEVKINFPFLSLICGKILGSWHSMKGAADEFTTSRWAA